MRHVVVTPKELKVFKNEGRFERGRKEEGYTPQGLSRANVVSNIRESLLTIKKSGRRGLPGRCEFQGEGVDTVAQPRRRWTVLEDVPEV